MPTNEDVADDLTMQDVQFDRATVSERDAFNKELLALGALLVLTLKKNDPTAPATAAGQAARMEKYRVQVRLSVRGVYNKQSTRSTRFLVDMADMAARGTKRAVDAASGINLFRRPFGPDKAKRIVESALVQGETSAAWWKAQAENYDQNLMRTLKVGLSENENLSLLASRIRGTRLAGFGDGMVGLSQRQAEGLIRTATLQTVNDSRLAMYEENDDVVRGVQAINPLDARTSAICRSRAGAAWYLSTGQPLPGFSWVGMFPGAPPWHWACRTVLVPVLRSASALRNAASGGRGRRLRSELDALNPRASKELDGNPLPGMTFKQWIDRVDQATAREALGPTKLSMWRRGKITTKDLVNQNGRPQTVAELKNKLGE